jgi:altronate dehydratase
MKAIGQGVTLAEKLARDAAQVKRAPFASSDLTVGVECGGSDALSGLTANPAVGIAADLLIAAGGTVIFGEVGELLGCENVLAKRAFNPEVAQQIVEAIQRARRWCRMRGIFRICIGNRRGGLTTIEEKSLGAMAKVGHAPIQGLLDGSCCERPPRKGLYLLNSVFYTDQALYGAGGGFDSTDVTSLAASGAHVVVFTTGRGSPIGSSVLPVLKIASSSQIFHYMADNMDINAGAIIDCTRTHEQVGQEIYEEILAVCAGKQTKAEILGHSEFHIPSRPPMPMDNIEREFFCRM